MLSFPGSRACFDAGGPLSGDLRLGSLRRIVSHLREKREKKQVPWHYFHIDHGPL